MRVRTTEGVGEGERGGNGRPVRPVSDVRVQMLEAEKEKDLRAGESEGACEGESVSDG